MFEELNLEDKKDKEEALGLLIDSFIEWGNIISSDKDKDNFTILDDLLEISSVEINFDDVREQWEERTEFFEILDCLIDELESTDELVNRLDVFREALTNIGSNYLESVWEAITEFTESLMELGYKLEKWVKKEKNMQLRRSTFYSAMELEMRNEEEWILKGLYDRK